MTIRQFSIPPAIHALALQFKVRNFQLYLVGGFVRDFILRKPQKIATKQNTANDFDFCTNAIPSEIKATLKRCQNINAIFDIGEKYGTIGAIVGGFKCEITTFRSEGEYKDHRHPQSVVFERDISKDLSRRDFTINAMAYDILEGKIIDIFSGMIDLKTKKIRAVGNANKRFSEDALRILRAFSLIAKFGFDIESTTMSAILTQKHLLKNISKERINTEITKILNGRFALKALKLMQKNDIFAMNLPKNFNAIPKSMRIYAIFLIFSDKNLLESLQNKRAKNIENIFISLDLARNIRKTRDLGRFFANLSLRFLVGDIKIAITIQSAVQKENRRFKKAFRPKILALQPKINGFDLQKLGFRDLQISRVKNALLVAIRSNDLPNQRAILMRKAKQYDSRQLKQIFY